MPSRLYIGNLSYETTEQDLRDLFEGGGDFGQIGTKVRFAASERDGQKVRKALRDLLDFIQCQLVLLLVQLFPIETVTAEQVALGRDEEDQADRKPRFPDHPAGYLEVPPEAH